jgi:DEAD/DEAH box helicase domain-containing protein
VDPEAVLHRLDAVHPGGLVHVHSIGARGPEASDLPDDVPAIVRDRLGLLGIESLYAHQRAGLDALRAGRDVVMATGTASGKSLVYQVAFAEAAVTTPRATGLLLVPSKALARDQLRAIRALKVPQVKAAPRAPNGR